MKKWIIPFLSIPLFIAVFVKASGLKEPLTSPTEIDEGDSPLFFNVACSPELWTAVISSDSIRRVAFIQSDYQIQPPICLGTAPALTSTIACNTSSLALILGTATTNNITVHTKNAWTCRTAGAIAVQTGTLHGYIGRDSRDFGAIGSTTY